MRKKERRLLNREINHNKIVVGSDHVAITLKQAVVKYLEKKGVQVIDVGPFDQEISVDYPDYAQLVASKVLSGEAESGIAICGTGIGMSMAANKVPGIRAGLCHDSFTAHQARAHNNANILCMGAWIVSPQRVGSILDEWLFTNYENGRHQKRLLKMENPAMIPSDHGSETSGSKKIKLGVSLSPNKSVFGPLLFAGQLQKGLEKAQENGFHVVELSLRDPAEINIAELQKHLSDHKLNLAAIATGQSCLHDSMCLASPDMEKVKAAVNRLEGHIKLASQFDAAVIIGGIRGKFSGNPSEMTAQRNRAISAVCACAEKAAKHNVQLLIEPINRYETNFINSAEEGISFIEETGAPEIKLLLDTFHMNLEEVDLAETFKTYSDRIGYIHFADSNRRAPGWGHIPFHQLLSTLVNVNYSGVITAEVLPLPDDNSAMQQSGVFFSSLVSSISGADSG